MFFFFFFNDTATTEIYTLSLHDALPILRTPLTALRGEAEVTLRHGPKPEVVYRDTLERIVAQASDMARLVDDLRSEEHTSELQSRQYLVCRLLLEKKKKNKIQN